MTNTIIALLPPLVAIILVVLTRRVILSLGAGSVTAAIILADFNIKETFSIIYETVKGVFFADGAWNAGNIYILLFLLILGVITAFISLSGGSRAFGEWAMKRVKTRVGAQLLTVVLGIIIFIDDYFNALTVGQISRPVTDRQKVSRVKLAYLIDSTSAPICVVAPISSWGASIIAIIGSILATHNITEYSAFSAFMQIIPMNFYVWATLAVVLIVAMGKLDIGPMKKHESLAINEGILFDPDKSMAGELQDDLPTSEKGSVGDLVWPIVVLFVGTIGAMFLTGYTATEGNVTIFSIFENTDVSLSLFIGGVLGLVVAFALFIKQIVSHNHMPKSLIMKGTAAGIKSMLPAVLILIFAWILADLIGMVGTGNYLASVIDNSSLNTALIPFLLFVIAAVMAFSTGTSWGSFGILLPIAGDIAVSTDISLLIPAMAAVLAGAVFGDHASPISDTSILSATGAGSNLIDHVLTQLPYALISAVIAAAGFLVIGFTGSTMLALITIAVLLLLLLLIGRAISNK
ncbi:Na+/H+ antiporter NhaC family protein [Cytobacillus purgationiresistens]|uniref:Na+/H+ antiporter NhaC n=1 Tax=Cytobacillus purgationiresistens TaxID=863449 RepID=A0ABU0ARJ5_9BACI|nr:Na+/H+ antiporter NhaC family protein [Cytobacillus purgationiresistens]MDQ0273048.1 Na+/H+ antiporter NhaC [Cytobacillus purgationiresistens]